MRVMVLIALRALAWIEVAHANERHPVTELKPLLNRAMDQGVAYGVLVGPAAAYIAQTFAATAPIEIDVSIAEPLPDPGCARLNVTTRQRDVREKTKRNDKELNYQLSYCRDGRFPEKR
jgi:hypothetical protein